ncbi:MAG: ChaN family lipoprotein [Desulfovibrio sp.]|nr:ChaN family lipoprotein [Desulfovibrio sp.]
MRHPLFLLIVICLGLAACAGPKPVPMEPLGLHFLPERGELALKSGEPAALADVDQLLRNADYILLGEGHTNVCDHAFQVQVLAYLLEGGQRPAVGLEMVGADMQPVLDRFSAGELPLESLPEALEWKSNWGYPFSLFAQQFELIRAYDLPVRALNAPRALVKAVSRDGLENLPGEDRALLPETVIPPCRSNGRPWKPCSPNTGSRGSGPGSWTVF